MECGGSAYVNEPVTVRLDDTDTQVKTNGEARPDGAGRSDRSVRILS
jgi:hypothetical protein